MITYYDHDQDKDVKISAKHKAQAMLLSGIQVAFSRFNEGESADLIQMTDREKTLVLDQMDKQMGRVEKMFGFEPGSWMRGC